MSSGPIFLAADESGSADQEYMDDDDEEDEAFEDNDEAQ